VKMLKQSGRRLFWTAILTVFLVVISSSLVAAMIAPPNSPSWSPHQTALGPDTPGVFALSNEAGFLYMTGTLPGTLGDAEWQWRTGIGAARRWWLSVQADNLLFFPKSRNTWQPDQATSASNYLALSVPLNLFQEWFWCGVRLYDRYHRFTGYGCDPQYGPEPSSEGQLAPWVETTVLESEGHVWQVLGAYCVIKRTAHIQIEPACPEEGQDVRIIVSGDWGNSCPEVGHTLLYSDKRFEIEGAIHSQEEVLCPSVVAGWTFTEDLGALEAGTYKVLVSLVDTETGFWSFQDGISFDVAPPPSSPQ
jgi:hypothetical protein